MANPSAHPHFDDHGTLNWNTRWADAVGEARQGGKLLFIEMGREACSNCRSLVSAVVPLPAVATLLKQRFVALAADCDTPEPEVLDLAMNHLADATMLPFVMFTDADGNYLGGTHGAVDPAEFLETLEALVD